MTLWSETTWPPIYSGWVGFVYIHVHVHVYIHLCDIMYNSHDIQHSFCLFSCNYAYIYIYIDRVDAIVCN